MTDNSKGSALQRYANVRNLILNTYNESCVRFKYDDFVNDLSQVDWNTTAAVGGLDN